MTALTHKTFATAEVETGKDAGSFTALVSTYEPDRQHEQVVAVRFAARSHDGASPAAGFRCSPITPAKSAPWSGTSIRG